jgi:hypothetical protein
MPISLHKKTPQHWAWGAALQEYGEATSYVGRQRDAWLRYAGELADAHQNRWTAWQKVTEV